MTTGARPIKHVLGLSGGKDSAALAVYMRDHYPELPIEYFFTDTGKELQEVYDFLGKLEGYLGRPILRLNPDRDFDFWLREYNHFLPSVQSRWCTRQLKLRPFENWVQPFIKDGGHVISYVAIRADEASREGYVSIDPNIEIQMPFRDGGVDKAGVMELLEASGVGYPEYYRWRSRSGCTFCFFQQKIEWVHLLEEHPEAFKEAMSYEKSALEHGCQFTWSDRESLEELSRPDRIERIKAEFFKRQEWARNRKRRNPLQLEEEMDPNTPFGDEDVSPGCLICHK